MKRINYRILSKKLVAIVLVSAMTASVIMSYDKAGQFFNSIRTVFADEVEDADVSSTESGDPTSPTTADPIEATAEEKTVEETAEPEVSETVIETSNTEDQNTEPSESDKTETDTTEATETTETQTSASEDKETNTTGTDSELKQRKVKAEGEDIYVSGLLPADVKVTAERVEVEISGAKVIAAYDIKVFDKNGNEWQPSEPLKISVASDECNSVTKNETEVIYVPDEIAESGKPVDIKNKNIEKIDAEVKDGKVEFEAGHFSVYVIIEHEGGEVVTPRVQFHFIAPVGEDYQPDGDNYTSAPYVFNNKATDPDAGNKQASMIVRDGDKLESIEAPMNTQNTYFYGWYEVNKSADSVTYNSSNNTYSGTITYSWPVNDPIRVELDKNVTVSAVKSGSTITSINWTVGNASGTCTGTDIDSEGCAHVYLAPIYSNYYFVNFHLGEKGTSIGDTLLSRKLIVLGSSNQTEVKVSDVQSPSNDPVHVVFIGWDRYNGSTPELIRTIDSNGEEIIQPGKDGTYITAGAATIDLYPHFVQARYINFDIGPSGNGALFVKPQLIYTSDDAEGDEYAVTSLSTTSRNGFTFGGWYTEADGAGVQITGADGNVLTTASVNEPGFKVSGGKIKAYDVLDSKTLYAYWIPNTTAQYKVVIWKQKSTDAPGIPESEKTYDYEIYYYDEDWNTSNPVTENVLRSFSGHYVDEQNQIQNISANLLGFNYTGFQYARCENLGNIDPQGGTVINVYYDRITYNVKFIFARRAIGNNGNETGNYMVPTLSSGFNRPNTRTWQVYCTEGNGISWDNAGTTVLSDVCSYNANTIQSDTYKANNNNTTYRYYFYVITANYGADIAGVWPDYSKFPVMNQNNNNTRRTLSGWWLMVGTALLPTNTVGGDTVKGVISIMNENILALTNEPDGNFLIASYRAPNNQPNDWTYNIYFETLDGVTYPQGTVESTASGNTKTFYLASSFLARSKDNFNGQNPPDYEGYGLFNKTQTGNSNIANFYYARKSFDLTFAPNYPPQLAGSAPAAQVFANIPYETSLASYSGTAAPAAPNNNYYFDGWYEDAACSVPFDFANATMPAAGKVIYAKWSLVTYPVNVNPNGGVIDSIDYSWFTAEQMETTGLSGTNNGFATYFDNTATQTIERYDNVKRLYVEVSDAEAAQMDPNDVYRYVYIYKSNQEGGAGKISAPGRVAVYIKDTVQSLNIFYQYYVHEVETRQARDPELVPLPRAQWEATYVSSEKYRTLRSGEEYVFLAWYEVVNGVRQNTPFDFSQPATSETTLIAEWRLEGGYSLLYTTEYYADNNDYITANLEDWTDPLDGHSKYSDGAATHAMQEPTSIRVNGKNSEDAEYVDYQFLGWQIVRVTTVNGRPYYTPLEPGVYYTAGQDLTVKARYSDENMVIHMQAVYQKRSEAYRRPDVVNLTLNAGKDAMGTAFGTLNSTAGVLPEWTWPGRSYLDTDTDSIIFGDTQSNTSVHLYKYATTLTASEASGAPLDPTGVKFFNHPAGYKLLGFDLDAYDTDFVPDYAADAVVAVTPGEQHTLYAVWEPMVYLDLVNTTPQALSISITSTNGNALYIVNQADGSFSRTPVNPNNLVIQPGTTRLVMPYGAGKDFTINGTNTLGFGWVMSVSSTYAGRSSDLDPAEVKDIKNTKTYSITDQLYEDAQGRPVTVTFSAMQMPRTLVLHDNDPIDATWEKSFDISETSYVLTETRVRVGRVFKGWADSEFATTATYPISINGSMNQTLILNDLFDDGNGGQLEVKHLYAVWGSEDQEGVVKVYKEVPAPGDQNKMFTFNVTVQGEYRRNSYNSYTAFERSNSFTLRNGEYLTLSMDRNTGGSGNRARLRVAVQKYNADGTKSGSVVNVGWENNNTNSFNDVRLTQVTVTETADPDYIASTEIVGLYSQNFKITPEGISDPNNVITWTNDRTGGTVVFANTRKTADVTIKKTLLPETLDPESFEFNVALDNGESYTLDPTSNYIVSGADAENGGEWKIEGIPTGATLTITENVDSERFDTTAQGIRTSDSSPATDLNTDGNVFSFVVTDNTIVTFTNTLKKQKVRLVVVDDLDDPLDSANFTFPGVFEGTKFSAAGTGLVWEGEVYAGEYTLTETSLPDHDGVRHTKLQAPATVDITGSAVTVTTGNPADTVNVEYENATQTYIIKVVNPRMMRITVKKAVSNDYGVNNFLFTVTLTDGSDNPIQLSNVYGSQGTNANGKMEFTLVNNQTALLYVPKNAKVQIEESEDSRYSTSYQIGPDAGSLGEVNNGTSADIDADSDKYVLFTNIRQKHQVTVAKTVIGGAGTFTFILQLKENNTAISNYTLSDNGTADTSDDIVTDADGVATFTLDPAANGTAGKVFTVHRGMSVSVTEAEDTPGKYTTTYVVAGDNFHMAGTGNSTGFVEVNKDITVTFTNKEAAIVAPTAVKDDSMTALIIMISSAVCFASAVVQIERKKRERGQELSKNDE